MNSNKIDFITSMITSSGIGVANHLKESIIICPCQVSGVDQSDENNIKEISDKIVHNWKRMIRKDKKLLETKTDLTDTRY